MDILRTVKREYAPETPYARPLASVLVVENEQLVAQHVSNVLRRGGFAVAGIVATGLDALEQVEHANPDLVVMDISLDGELDGVDVGRRLAETRATPIVYLTGRYDNDTLARIRATNAVGFVVKPFSNEQLHSAVVLATAHLRTGGARPELWEARAEIAQLSPVELDVLRHIASGRRISSIADLRGVSPHTIRNQLKAVFRKLQVHSQRELVDWLHSR
jgi:DNA-binding NarL/FixJ family response regulator